MGDTEGEENELPELLVTSEMCKLSSTKVIWHLKEWNQHAEFLKDNAGCLLTLKKDKVEDEEENLDLMTEIKLRFFLKDFECKMAKKLKNWYSLWVELIGEPSHVTFEVEVTEDDENAGEQAEEEVAEEDVEEEEDDEDDEEEIQIKSQVTLGSVHSSGESVVVNPVLVKEELILMSCWKLDDNGEKTGNEKLSEWAEAEEIKLKIKVTLFKYIGSDIQVNEDETNGEDDGEETIEEVEVIPITRDLREMYSQEENYSDLLLETRDGMILNCHRFVLAARSSYFKGVLEKEVKKKGWAGTIKIGNVDGKAMGIILHWMYADEMHEDMGKVMDEVIKVSVKWELGDLLKLLDKKLVTACTTRNMMHLFQVAHKHGLFTAIEDISQFIKENIDSVVPTRKSSMTR